MSAKPDDTWAIELLEGLLPELNRRADEANERIRVFETFLREKGVAIQVEVGPILFSKIPGTDESWRIRSSFGGAPLLECQRHIKLQAMTAWDVFVATVVERVDAYAKGKAL